MKRILVIGGTQFIGRHTVELLLSAGHEVVLVNRGQTGPELFPGARRIVCDRRSDEFYLKLKKESGFDAVLDFWAYFPADVERLILLLPGLARHYIQISSMSAYKVDYELPVPIIREEDPLLECTQEQAVVQSPSSYGPRKAKCERLAMHQSSAGIPTTVFRPKVIYGRWDHTDRFAYWIWRAVRRQPFLLPEDGRYTVQLTYATDFARAIIKTIGNERLYHKAYNFAEASPLNLRGKLAAIGKHLKMDPLEFAIPASAEQLDKMNVEAWSDLPLWIPRTDSVADTSKVRGDLALDETPVERAIAEACDAFLELGRPPRTGLSMERERELVREIQSSSTG